MSQQHTENITCPHCGSDAPMEIWDSVNVDLNPDLKNKILDESLFLWTCPKCQTKRYITFSTLYHDMNGQYMLFFDHNAGDKDISEDSFPESELFGNFNKKYTLRYVHGIHRLKEKIFIFDEGLSDIAVEMIKYLVRNDILNIPRDNPNFFIGKEIYFTELSNDGEKLIFSVSDQGHVVGSFGISMDIYEQCLQKIVLDERFKETKSSIKNVCYEWIEARLKAE